MTDCLIKTVKISLIVFKIRIGRINIIYEEYLLIYNIYYRRD